MEKEEIEKLVVNLLEEACRSNGLLVSVGLETPLIGSQRILDSMGLVNFIIDLESLFLDQNIEISLMSENAMSPITSPFRNLRKLSAFIERQLNGK